MEVSLVQLSSYEDSINQFQKWVAETQTKVKAENELKATLPEKKVQLQSHKVSEGVVENRMDVNIYCWNYFLFPRCLVVPIRIH